jgi:putative tryptophan/tyrosine transport system substrate-binding protein
MRMNHLTRREFIAILAGTAAAWPVATRAAGNDAGDRFSQRASPASWAPFVAAFRQGLREAGFVDDQNVAIELSLGVR